MLLLPPLIRRLQEKGSAEIVKFTVAQLRLLIRYEFNHEEGRLAKHNKTTLVGIAMKHYDDWLAK